MDGRVNRSRYKGKANVENELQAFVRLSADPQSTIAPAPSSEPTLDAPDLNLAGTPTYNYVKTACHFLTPVDVDFVSTVN